MHLLYYWYLHSQVQFANKRLSVEMSYQMIYENRYLR